MKRIFLPSPIDACRYQPLPRLQTDKHCNACGKPHWYPRVVCPLCGSDDVEWREASGRGEVYSFSVVRRMGEPYVLAFVTLEEGPTVMTNIVDTPLDALRME